MSRDLKQMTQKTWKITKRAGENKDNNQVCLYVFQFGKNNLSATNTVVLRDCVCQDWY